MPKFSMYNWIQFYIASYVQNSYKYVWLNSSVCVCKNSSTISYTKSLYKMTVILYEMVFVRNDLTPMRIHQFHAQINWSITNILPWSCKYCSHLYTELRCVWTTVVRFLEQFQPERSLTQLRPTFSSLMISYEYHLPLHKEKIIKF